MPFLFQIDFNNDYDTSDTDEDISDFVISARWGLGTNTPYQSVGDMQPLVMTVINEDGRWNPGGTAGPYYGTAGTNLKGGRRVAVYYQRIGSEPVSMWRGFLHSVKPQWVTSGDHTGKTVAEITCYPADFYLQEKQVRMGVRYNKTVQQLAQEIISNVGLLAAGPPVWTLGITGLSELGVTTRLAGLSDFSNIGTTALTLPVWVPDNDEATHQSGLSASQNAFELLRELAEAERGLGFFARDGRYTLIGRGDRTTLTSISGTIGSEQCDFIAATVSPTYRPQSIEYEYGREVLSRVVLKGKQITQANTEQTLYSLNGAWGGDANDVGYLFAELRDSENRRVSSTGVRAANVQFFSGNGAINVDTFGDYARIQCNWGAAGGTVVNLDLVGIPTYRDYSVSVEQENGNNIGIYGNRSQLVLDLPLIASEAELRTIAAGEMAWRGDERHEILSATFVRGVDDQQSSPIVLNLSIGSVVVGNFPELGLLHGSAAIGNYNYVIGEDHEYSEGTHRLTYHFENHPGATNPYKLPK